MDSLICHIKEFIQPFERYLAIKELEALAQGPVIPLDGDYSTAFTFSITGCNNVDLLRESLAYWHSVGNKEQGLTAQLRREATHEIARTRTQGQRQPQDVGVLIPSHLPNRRSLRYGTHGLHEYRGKFFPQLCHALINIARTPPDGIVLDPMAGSGTTLVEARLSGRKSYGLDMNPLAVFVANAKCQALDLEPTELSKAYTQLEKAVRAQTTTMREEIQPQPMAVRDRAYIEDWFCENTLSELDRIKSVIRRLPNPVLENFFLAVLSNILREVSHQKTDDLRSRRKDNDLARGETTELFLKKASRLTQTLSTFLSARQSSELGRFDMQEADARQTTRIFPELEGQVDTIITSPPYATALPYIDTDRLSLIYLGLLPRGDHQERNKLMIGNREISPGERNTYWVDYQDNRRSLPDNTQTLIELIHDLNETGVVGFRRKNLAALLARYFFDMRETLSQAFAMLRPGRTMFLVVGNNQTTAGTTDIEINTPQHLAEIAEGVGFHVSERITMEMLVSRDIFRHNAVPSEDILRFEKPHL